MTPEEYWKRIERDEAAGFREPGAAEARAAHIVEWYLQRRKRRRQLVRIVALGLLGGLGAVLLIVSMSMHRPASTSVARTEPVSVPSSQTAAASMPPQQTSGHDPLPQTSNGSTDAMGLTRSQVVASPPEPEGSNNGEQKGGRLSASESDTLSALPSAKTPATSEAVSARPQPLILPPPSIEEKRTPELPAPTAQAAPDGRASEVVAGASAGAYPSDERAQPVLSLPRLPQTPVTPPPSGNASSSEPRREGRAGAVWARLRQATALTPAEAQRLEQLKTVLGYLPEVWLAKQVIGFVSSVPAPDIEQQRSFHERRQQRFETP